MIYSALEDVEPIFKECMRALGKKLGLPERCITFAATLKDPIRIHQKALDEYLIDESGRPYFDDYRDEYVIPEANVIDVIRARAHCSSGRLMLEIQQELGRGFVYLVGGLAPARISLVTCKNRVRDHDPTHFRNICNSLLLEYDGRQTFVELQAHHATILAFNEVRLGQLQPVTDTLY